ncbi:MAG: nucleoside hydrolase [Clostridiales bacterium]|jgi:inosine-uridine nucleoside N-ribohydrolase|nr:nucleoside hydrolase [Clostridiales bacterium]
MKTRVLIDTDIGGDVDDAIALALALSSPEISVAGISLVYLGNAWRHGILSNMLEVYGRKDIPVAIGAEKPLIGSWGQSGDTEAERSGASPVFIDERNRAAEFIIRLCEDDPELTLVPIGPLTNLAAAMLAAPRIAKGRRIMLMGGSPGDGRAEWNFLCDPEAAVTVLNSGAAVSIVGLNVTELCRFTQAEVDSFAHGGKKERLLYEMMRDFTREHYLPVLHDPLAVGALLWDDVIAFEKKRVSVELCDRSRRGALTETENGAEVRIATEVNPELFRKRLIETVKE